MRNDKSSWFGVLLITKYFCSEKQFPANATEWPPFQARTRMTVKAEFEHLSRWEEVEYLMWGLSLYWPLCIINWWTGETGRSFTHHHESDVQSKTETQAPSTLRLYWCIVYLSKLIHKIISIQVQCSMKEILALDLPRKWWPSSSRGIVMQIRICQVAWSKMMDWGPSVNFVNLGSESYCHKRGVLSLTWSSSEHQLKVSIFFRLKQRMQVLDGGHCTVQHYSPEGTLVIGE